MALEEKIIKLRSSDGEEFKVAEPVVAQSRIIRDMAEDDDSADIGMIDLPGVTASILSKVIEYCEKHVTDNIDGLKAWDVEFVEMESDALYELFVAADYLKIDGLFDLICEEEGLSKGDSPAEFRRKRRERKRTGLFDFFCKFCFMIID